MAGRQVSKQAGKQTVHPTEIRTSISPSSAVELNMTSALANYATEAAVSVQDLTLGIYCTADDGEIKVLNPVVCTGSDRNFRPGPLASNQPDPTRMTPYPVCPLDWVTCKVKGHGFRLRVEFKVKEEETFVLAYALHLKERGGQRQCMFQCHTNQCIYSSVMASLVLTDSSQLTFDSQHLGIDNSYKKWQLWVSLLDV
uniref:Uncharacterized protein n=1 Tax=Timema poppense TaxID=170557 RepID=A0A7R9CF98_TIMPO|nr:unnamed protein product [Timema poppensis]